jgi:tRNA (guanine37-N1)-methyltransferase
MSHFHACILTLFPEMFPGPLGFSLAGKALQKGIWSYDTINIRDFGIPPHNKVDDEQYGGGSGLVMRADVLGRAIDEAFQRCGSDAVLYYPSPRGERINQGAVKNIIKENKIIILCGRFEGIDERIIQEYNAKLISVGDCILSGGEIAALCILDSSIRLLPGVLANSDTLSNESFEGAFNGCLESPLYTRPFDWRGLKVPEVLLSGNHGMIEQWKVEQSKLLTALHRPDLLRR